MRPLTSAMLQVIDLLREGWTLHEHKPYFDRRRCWMSRERPDDFRQVGRRTVDGLLSHGVIALTRVDHDHRTYQLKEER